MGRVTGCLNGITCTVDGDTLALFNLDNGAWLDGQVAAADGQEVAAWADSVWGTFVVPNTFDVVA